MKLFNTFSIIIILIFWGCKKDPQPESGFNEPFYLKFNFEGEEIINEEEDINVSGVATVGFGTSWVNRYRNDSGNYDVEFKLEFDDKSVTKQDIKDLEGKELPINGSSYPWMRVYLINNHGAQDYSTGLDEIDYGISNFFIDEVIKGPKIDVGDKRKRSYILRGEFDFNISKSSWTLGVPDTLYPITNGEFSMRIFVP
ncbi:MAG: hypothetical protein JKX95_05250 [Bacteroidia bacterium]|nr:hypothetical protein [Bacteroidia bacterium]